MTPIAPTLPFIGIVTVAQEDAQWSHGSFGQNIAAIFANISAALLTEDDVHRGAFWAMDFSAHGMSFFR